MYCRSGLEVIGAAWRPAGPCSTTAGGRPCMLAMQAAAVAGQSCFATVCVLIWTSQARPALLACVGTLGTQPCLHTVQASEDLCLRVWDCRSMSVAQSLTGQPNIPLCCDCSPDGESTHRAGQAPAQQRGAFQEAGACMQVYTLLQPAMGLMVMAARCASGTGGGSRCWRGEVEGAPCHLPAPANPSARHSLCRCQGHSQAATCCSFLPPALASQSEEQRQGHERECSPVQQAPALLIASGSRDKTVRLWDGSDGSCLAVTEFLSDPHAAVTTMTHVPPSPDMLNDVLCAGNFDGQLQAWTCCRDPAGLHSFD